MPQLTAHTALVTALVLATGCAAQRRTAGASPDRTTTTTSTAAGPGAIALSGPVADPLVLCPCCTPSPRHPLAGARGVTAVAMIARPGEAALLAIETPRGWFVEVPPPRAADAPPLWSHHEPRSITYDLAATRVRDGRVLLRQIDHSSVFYPGQGGDGMSATLWLDRSCRLDADTIRCTPAVAIAHEQCTHDQGTTQCKGTGAPPPR